MKHLVTLAALLAAVLLVLGFFAPKRFELQRRIVVEKPNSVVYAYLTSLKNQKDWNAFLKKDPPNYAQKFDYQGADGAVGSKMRFSLDEGQTLGETELTKLVDGEWVESEISMQKPFQAKFTSILITKPLSRRKTEVTMGMIDEMEFPMNVICLIMNPKKKLKKDFDQSLANMKQALEKP